jgi:hypothetical protein
MVAARQTANMIFDSRRPQPNGGAVKMAECRTFLPGASSARLEVYGAHPNRFRLVKPVVRRRSGSAGGLR